MNEQQRAHASVRTSEPAGMSIATRAALWMAGALASFALMAVSVRELAGAMDIVEMIFLRSLVALVILGAFLPRYGARIFRTQRFELHALRNVLHFAGQYAWIYAIAALPLATVFAIEFTMPVWATVLAVVLLRERLSGGRLVMLGTGLAGILIILQPGFGPVPPAALVMLAGSLAYAATMIATKALARDDAALTVLFYMALVQGALGFLLALPSWVMPQAADLPWVLALGATSVSSHFCLTRAFRIADATLVVPFDFMRLPLIALVGALVYGETPGPMTFLGAAVICGGIYYSIRRESGAAKR